MKMLEWGKTIALLKQFKIPVAEEYSVNAKSLAERAKKLGFPLAIKALSPKIIHKTEEGFIKIAGNEEQLTKAFEKMQAGLKKRRIKADIILQKFVEGTETIIGVKEDPVFGKVVMFGLGGVFAEALKEVSFGMIPVDEQKAEEMIKEVKGYRILEGYRGKKANTEKLAELMANVSKLCEKNKISELDLNPVVVNEKEAVVVDARIIC